MYVYCLDKGIFPRGLKVATTKLLYKNGNKLDVKNYRPISPISNIAKIFEKLIKTKVNE